MDDKELLRGLFAGERKHQKEFLRNYTPMLYSIARKINARDPSLDFDDLVHEGFLHLFERDFKRLRNFQFKAKLSTFIFTVVRRYLLSKVTRTEPDKECARELERVNPNTISDLEWDFLFHEDPEMEALRQEHITLRNQALQQAMESLKPEEQLQIRYHMDGYSTEKIMKLLKFANRAQLDKRKFTIIQKLKKEIHKIQIGQKHAK